MSVKSKICSTTVKCLDKIPQVEIKSIGEKQFLKNGEDGEDFSFDDQEEDEAKVKQSGFQASPEAYKVGLPSERRGSLGKRSSS